MCDNGRDIVFSINKLTLLINNKDILDLLALRVKEYRLATRMSQSELALRLESL